MLAENTEKMLKATTTFTRISTTQPVHLAIGRSGCSELSATQNDRGDEISLFSAKNLTKLREFSVVTCKPTQSKLLNLAQYTCVRLIVSHLNFSK